MRNLSDRAVGNAWLSFSAIGGLMASLAVPGYAFAVIVPVAFCYFSYRNYKIPKNKRTFLKLAIANVICGFILHTLPHHSNGGLTGVGMVLATVVLIPSFLFIFIIYKSEPKISSVSSENL